MAKGPGKSCSILTSAMSVTSLKSVAHQGKQNVRAACPKDKLHGIQVFLWALSTMVYHGCLLMFCYSVLYVK